ncbi:MAG: extracellular solute-binding protein [Dorea sp.]|jgi:raffinose/stachyose/melibiose transport system substrate-binding protein|nr:extracellular solute-binding protein [Dorea sp.]
MKKRVAKLMALSMAAAMTASLAACGGGDSGSGDGGSSSGGDSGSASGGDKEIVYWNIGTESPDKDVITKAVEKFNSETESGYTVTSVPTQNDTYKEKLVVAMSSGECPDMYSCWSGGPMYEYIDSGFGQPIDDLFNASEIKDKLMESAVSQATYNDHVYAVPYQNISMSGIFYNKEMFDKYKLKEPETLADLENICDTLKKNDITPFALANSSKWTGSMYYMNLAARYGGLEPFQKAVAGEGKFTDDCFIKAGEKVQEWVEAGYFPDGVNSLSEDDGQAKQLMYQETAGMLLCGSWYTGTFATDSAEFYEKIGWFPFPAIEESDADPSIMIGTVGDQFIVFNCEGEKLEAAFECAEKHLDEEVIDFEVENGKIPPVQGIESKLTDSITKEVVEAANNASEIQLWYDQYLPPAVATAHLDGLQEVFGLTKTPQEAQEAMQKAMDDYLANKAE